MMIRQRRFENDTCRINYRKKILTCLGGDTQGFRERYEKGSKKSFTLAIPARSNVRVIRNSIKKERKLAGIANASRQREFLLITITSCHSHS